MALKELVIRILLSLVLSLCVMAVGFWPYIYNPWDWNNYKQKAVGFAFVAVVFLALAILIIIWT